MRGGASELKIPSVCPGPSASGMLVMSSDAVARASQAAPFPKNWGHGRTQP